MTVKPIDLEEATLIVHHLAFNWSQAKLPSEHMAYVNFIRAIDGLLAATGTAKQTASIFAGVINQACALGRTSEWVGAELRFEAAAVSNRPEGMLADLARWEPVDDDALDLYNERLTRFR